MSKRHFFLILITSLFLTGCSSEDQSSPKTAATTEEVSQEERAPLHQKSLSSLADLSFRQTTEVLHLSHQLHISINKLLSAPSADTLTAAQQAYKPLLSQWVKSLPYINMTALTSTGAPLMNRIEKLPMLPGYLDQLPEYPFSGLVHDIMIPIDPNTLTLMHSLADDEQVIFGLSAIEFILFDHFEQDHYKKFIPQNSLPAEEAEQEITLEQLPNNRRRALLSLQINQLVEDLSELHKRWEANTGDDAKRLSALSGKNMKLALIRSYNKSTQLILDALNSIQEKPLTLGRAHFAREENALLLEGMESLFQFHQDIQPIWEVYDQPEKDEFTAVLNSLKELLDDYKESPNNRLLLELASNRCTQLIEISHDIEFEQPAGQ